MTKVIRVQFPSGDSPMRVDAAGVPAGIFTSREYDYFLLDDKTEVPPNACAVVQVGDILKIVKVVGIMRSSVRAAKHAIAVFDLKAHREALTRKNEIEALKQDILARAEDTKQRQKLNDLASEDPILKQMLDDLHRLESPDVVAAEEAAPPSRPPS
jgi:hypothetical protein